MWGRRRSDPVMMEHHRLLLRHAYLSHTKPHHTIPYHTVPYHVWYTTCMCLSHKTIPHHTMPYCVIPIFCKQNHTVTYYATPWHIYRLHTIPYCIIPCNAYLLHTICPTQPVHLLSIFQIYLQLHSNGHNLRSASRGSSNQPEI